MCNTSFTNNSDSKLKDKQRTADAGQLQAIFDGVEVKSYERNDLDNQERTGFIAQELEALLPESCRHIVGEGTMETEAGEQTIKTVDYARLTTILWSVCKGLQRRLDALEQASP